MASFVSVKRLNIVDFPTLGRPTMATKLFMTSKLLIEWRTHFQNVKTKKGPSEEGPKNGVDILSRESSTICAGGLNFSVRNGKRWTAPQ